MDHRIRLIAGAAVMLVGLGVGDLFPPHIRRDGACVRRRAIWWPSASSLIREVLRSCRRRRPLGPCPPRRKTATRSPAIVTPSDQPAPPPDFPKSYPSSSQMASAMGNFNGRLAAGKTLLATQAQDRGRRHTAATCPAVSRFGIAGDGDLQANRDVLSDPNILPLHSGIEDSERRAVSYE